MKTLDPGHRYECESYDGESHQIITFMKREGERYPGNSGHYAGTNCQELLRVLIDRLKYLQGQIPCWYNLICISLLRVVLTQFEIRAAALHHRTLPPSETIELEPTCKTCGHIACDDVNHNMRELT